jgi:hypothetical protein
VTALSDNEYAEFTYVDGFGDVNLRAAVENIGDDFLIVEFPDRRVFSSVYLSISETGAVPQRRCERLQRRRRAQVEDDVLETEQSTTSTGIRRTANRLSTPQTTLCRTEYYFGVYQFSYPKCSKLLSQMTTLHGKNFVTGSWATRSYARQFYLQMNYSSKRNSHTLSPQKDNPHAIIDTHFQALFSVNILCDVIGNDLFGPSEREDHQIGEG